MKIFYLFLIFILLFGCAMPGGQPPSATPTPASIPSESPATQTAPEPAPSPVPQPQPDPQPIPVPAPQPIAKPQPKLINGKTLDERLQEASDRLHTQGSGQHARDDFPDLQLVYTDPAQGTGFPEMILPFRYYYSKEADKTFNICNIDFTVFICKGKLDKLITKNDVDSGRCEVAPVYQDPRAGGSGGQGYRYGN